VANLSIAALGAAPGLRLAVAAPRSANAEHLKSHIFLRFGNWTQVRCTLASLPWYRPHG
jgi:hypothetical protein